MKVARRAQASTGRAFTVSGMGADEKKRFESVNVGLSYSSTLAVRALRAGVEATSWVIRNEDGDEEGRVTLCDDGMIYLRSGQGLRV